MIFCAFQKKQYPVSGNSGIQIVGDCDAGDSNGCSLKTFVDLQSRSISAPALPPPAFAAAGRGAGRPPTRVSAGVSPPLVAFAAAGVGPLP